MKAARNTRRKRNIVIMAKNEKKSFVKGRKQEIEILFMYYWIHDMEGDNDYWQEYLETVLPGLKKTL